MTVEQKARQLALTLVAEDQNPQPLIAVLMEMATLQRGQMMKGRVKINVNSDMDIVIKTNDMWEAAKAIGYKHGDVNLIVVPKED